MHSDGLCGVLQDYGFADVEYLLPTNLSMKRIPVCSGVCAFVAAAEEEACLWCEQVSYDDVRP